MTESSNDYNLNDTYFIDGFHPSEIFVAMQISKYNDLFKQRIDTSLLSSSINNRYCNLLFDLNEMNTNAQQSAKRNSQQKLTTAFAQTVVCHKKNENKIT